MNCFSFFIFGSSCMLLVGAQRNNDLFNYGFGTTSNVCEGGDTECSRPSFAQEYWAYAQCKDADTCTAYPNKFPTVQAAKDDPSKFGWTIDDKGNFCEWCPFDGAKNCGVHRQSPIDLERFPAVHDHPGQKNCTDWHWMAYKDDSCTFDDMRDQFTIERHALQMHIPTLPDGRIDCVENGVRRFARLDYSKGFPDWWWLARTDITTPSQHWQEGNQYAAEVTLAHFYSIAHSKNDMGYVTIFLQDYPDAESWPYLDKLICQWREQEEKTREQCGLPPAPPYGRCRLFRDQDKTETPTGNPTTSPTSSPTSSPTGSPTDAPTTEPTERPTTSPTTSPTGGPSGSPSSSPSMAPTPVDSNSPSLSMLPTVLPTVSPTASPTASPSASSAPSENTKPTIPPTFQPSTSSAPSKSGALSENAEPIIPPTLQPSASPTSSPTASPTTSPTASPTASPTSSPTASPTTSPTTSSPTSTPTKGGIDIDCDAEAPRVGFERMCFSVDPCCEQTRADTRMCWEIYDDNFPGDRIKAACDQCCDKQVGENFWADPQPDLPWEFQCSSVNAFRMCKPNSCCTASGASSGFCQDQLNSVGFDNYRQICWYCCSESKDFPQNRRALEEAINDVVGKAHPVLGHTTSVDSHATPETRIGDDEVVNSHQKKVDAGFTNITKDTPRIAYAEGGVFQLSDDDLTPDEGEDEFEYFNRIYGEFKQRDERHRRLSDEEHEINYEDVEYWPYEWMLKVGTEYYFRYEGTQVVPPCREFVHWRVMKDPLRVHKRQIDELGRLLAWRVNPDNCKAETAGVKDATGNKVNVARKKQYFHTGHRMVFCECQDWPSKFDNDRAWCKDWRQDDNYDRLYKWPYSFPTYEWLPGEDNKFWESP